MMKFKCSVTHKMVCEFYVSIKFCDEYLNEVSRNIHTCEGNKNSNPLLIIYVNKINVGCHTYRTW